MPEPTVITDPKEEKKVENKSLGQEVRDKSFNQLLKEQQAQRSKPAEETDKAPLHTEEDNKKAEDDRLAQEAETAKQKIEAEEADKKRQEDLAAKAAENVIKKQQDEAKAEQDRLKAEEAAKEHEKSLQPKWKTDPNAPKDEHGNPIPRSYDELQEEAARIAEEKAYARLTAEQAKRDADAKEKQEAEAQSEKQKQEAAKAFEDQLQKELDTDLKDLYANDKLPKVKDPNNENDEGNKEFRNLFETAQRVNAERMAKGEPPIRSIKLIYYEYYKPLAKPAGHDAPVLGNESPLSHEAPEDRYIPSRDRKKSMTQLIKEERDRLMKKINVRGV